ncbi:hypothetical protein K5I29_06450 [Flavobacterium agricola]|uniref:Uncharacterized protein n=1 Tax=Flavobacterium agricola TaxID=2870839 RepID=A0ABY6M1U0_9FLAO|nr:hypothetical protein [Flavobacterium agricola]UYW02510.1 hypothetical protein K5I29_06450 [Flavobacterium agricola]
MNTIKMFFAACFMLLTASGWAQARTDFTATAVTMSAIQKNGKWSEYPPFKKTEVPITIDFERNRIIVYSEFEQVYRIAEYYPEKENNTEFINFFRCLSNEGETTEITLTTSKTTKLSQMYIKDKSRVLLYTMKQL